MIEKVDHIGIIVKNMEEVLKIYRDYLGLKVENVELVEETKVKTAFLPVADTHIELVEVIDPSFTRERTGLDVTKQGLHHISLKVTNINDVLERLKESGVKLIHEKPLKGARGSKIAFIDPKATKALIELVERSE